MPRTILAALLLIGMPAAAWAQLDPETSEPYQYHIVLHFGKNRLLTDVFKQRIAAELRDWFEGALGDMAKVTVGESHPLLPEIERRGLDQALDGQLQPQKDWRPVNATKTHFVLIDYVDGQYQVQTRQQDGFTGLASPMVRIERTPDRSFVARTAARLMEHDFGPVGTIDPGATGSLEKGAHALEVTITLRASSLGVLKERWVNPGDIFAVARIFASQGRQGSYRVPWALLQVTEAVRDGRCRCQLFSRLENPLALGSTTYGYRCLKLGTTTAPLRMRLVNDQNSGPLNFSVRATVSQQGFSSPGESLTPDDDGLIKTTKAYTNMAFVTVYRGETTLALVPLEIVGDRIVACPISSNESAGIMAELDGRRRLLVRQIDESRAIAAQRFTEIAQQAKENAKEKARETARIAADELEKDLSSLKIDLATLREAIRGHSMEDKLPLDEPNSMMEQLGQRLVELRKFTGKASSVLAEDTNPARAKWYEMADRAKLMEQTADFDEAIKLYAQVLKELPEGDAKRDLQKHKDELENVWNKVQGNPELAEARNFVYQVWPKLDSVKELSDKLPKLQLSFEACKAAGDYLTPQKLLLSFPKQAGILRKRQDVLEQSPGGQDVLAEIKTIGEISHTLEELEKSIAKFIADNRPK